MKLSSSTGNPSPKLHFLEVSFSVLVSINVTVSGYLPEVGIAIG
jgi:hypothetical protein